MEVVNSYRDGSVDLQSGVALTESGVTKFRFPRLAFAAEKTGSIASYCAYRTRGIFGMNSLQSQHDVESISPSAARRIGMACMAVASLAVVTQLPKIPEVVGLTGQVEGMINSLPDLDFRIPRLR